MKNKVSILLVLLIMFLPIIKVNAVKYDSIDVIKDKYHYYSNNGEIIEDNFEYRDDYFTESSYLGNKGLEVLSIQLASSSISWFSEDDKYETNTNTSSRNVVELLRKMNFSNIAINKYYEEEMKENSIGVALGHKSIMHDNKMYTLLAIVPRSAGYKQEWAGNFNIGNQDIHLGFKLSRDEILRFVKKYIQDNNIEGSLKIWTVGYSRGAAISDMIGGFFAGGGIKYFGDNVSLTPEDIYGYTLGTPRTIKNGLSKNVELSVSANREDSMYASDTKGDVFNYTQGGTVNAKDDIYKGLRNIVSSDDIISLLPFEEWEYTYYGKTIQSDYGVTSISDVLNELKIINSTVYNLYTENNVVKKIKKKTFDLKSLSIVDENDIISQTDFIKERFKGLLNTINSSEKYADEYQEAFTSLAGVFGMGYSIISNDNSNIDTSSFIEPLLFTYLSYVSNEYLESGKANSEKEAVALVIEELFSYFTGEEINNNNFTIDDLIRLLAKYISDNENEAISDNVVNGIVGLVPEAYSGFLNAFSIFDKNYSQVNVTTEQGLKAFIKACYYGADPQSEVYSTYSDPKNVRSLLYTTIGFVSSTNMPEIMNLIVDQEGKLTGAGKFEDLVDIVLNNYEVIKDEDGNVIANLNNISELADYKLVNAIDSLLENPIKESANIYGEEYKNEFENHVNNLKNNITKTRKILSLILLYSDKGYNVKDALESISTFIGNGTSLILTHFNDIYLAQSKNAERYEKYECLEGQNQYFDLDNDKELTFRFSFDYNEFINKGKVFVDYEEVSSNYYTLSEGSTIITFNKEFLNKLSEGTHSIMLSLDGKKSRTQFNIVKNIINPKTNDNIIKYVNLSLISIIGIIVVNKCFKKEI